MSKNYKKICLALALTGVVGASAVTAKSGNQSITATYRNIQVTYNGATQPMANEPFLVNGSVYVPLRAVGDIFGATPNWIPGNNTVAITGGSVGGSSSAAIQEELTQAKYQITALNTELTNTKAELAKANAELAQYKANANNNNNNNSSNNTNTSGTNITNAQLKDTENYLNEKFSDYLKNINMNYSLSLYGNQIQVEMSFNNRQENNNFKKLSQYNVQSFMKKIGDNIAATHSDVNIEGRVLYGSEEKAAFSRSRTGNYNYTYAVDKDVIEDVVRDRLNNYFYLDGVKHSDGRTVSSLRVDNISATVRDTNSKVNVTINLANDSVFEAIWGIPYDTTKAQLNDSTRNYAVRNQLNILLDEISSITNDYDINIYIYYKNTMIAQMDADERITTASFTI